MLVKFITLVVAVARSMELPGWCGTAARWACPSGRWDSTFSALHWYYLRKAGHVAADPFAEDWRPAFAIVEEGATVDPAARLHDSVVLRGGRVERGAVLVRSLVCAGGAVGRDRTVVDQLVRNGAVQRDVKRHEHEAQVLAKKRVDGLALGCRPGARRGGRGRHVRRLERHLAHSRCGMRNRAMPFWCRSWRGGWCGSAASACGIAARWGSGSGR